MPLSSDRCCRFCRSGKIARDDRQSATPTVAMLALALCAGPVAAQPYHPYHPYDPGRGFETMLGVIITNALRPRYQPPPPAYTYVPVTGAQPRSPGYAAPPRTQEQWKAAIVAEAQRFCDAYPRDPICHFHDDR